MMDLLKYDKSDSIDYIYNELEKKMVKYSELVNVPIRENDDRFVDIKEESIKCGREISINDIDKTLNKLTGGKIYLRKEAFKRLLRADRILNEKFSDLRLQVVCGYRPMEIQRELYRRIKDDLTVINKGRPPCIDEIHKFVAVPEVAGHPSGGAIDVQIVNRDGKSLDFGTQIMDFERKSYTFSPEISKEAKQNRVLLREVLMDCEFAPFDGEWWHFSYGDREWAVYYKKEFAHYSSKNFNDVKQNL